MNKNIYRISFIISSILLITFFILEYDRKTLRGTYIGAKCNRESNNTFIFGYNILELNYDNTFQFKNKNKNNIINGTWYQFDEKKIIFTSQKYNIKHIAKFNRHNIYFRNEDSTNLKNRIPYVDLCHTYPGSEKKWWESIWGFFSLIIFIINLPISISGLLKLNTKNSGIDQL